MVTLNYRFSAEKWGRIGLFAIKFFRFERNFYKTLDLLE